MKTTLMTLILLASVSVWSATGPQKTYRFQFKTIKNPIVQIAASQQDAFRLAAKECFKTLTGGQYPGEEKGLDIIDICANPKI